MAFQKFYDKDMSPKIYTHILLRKFKKKKSLTDAIRIVLLKLNN